MKQFSIQGACQFFCKRNSFPTKILQAFLAFSNLGFFMFAATPSTHADTSVPAYFSALRKECNANSLTADLALVKTVNDNTPDQNQVVTFTLVISNSGPNPATAATVRDVVPAGMTFVVGSQTGPGTYNSSNPPVTGVNWQNLFIANGGSIVLTFQATVTAAGGSVITNFAEVAASVEVDPDSTPNNGNVGEDDGDTETVTVNVVNPPVVLTCPVNTTTASCQTQAAVNTAFATWLATANGSGGCGGVLTNNNTGAPPACGGSTTVTFTYTSTCAPLTTTCNATFTVSAPASPTPVFANCTNNTINLGCNPFNLPSCAGIASGGFGGAVTASNSCGTVPVNCSAGSIIINGCTRTQVFTFDATACGQTVTCSRTYTWNVVTPPSFNGTCGNGVVNLGCNPATLPSCDPNVTASNECGSVPVTCSLGAITSNGCNRSQQITYTANAVGCGTFSTCIRIFNWTVDPPATLTCPTNLTVAACQSQAAVDVQFSAWLNSAIFTGGCNGAITNNNTGAPSFCGGSKTVTFTLTTACQPVQTCQATFTVTAAPPPSLTCPNPLTRPVCQTRAQDSIALQNWVNTSSFSGGCNGSISFNGFDGRPPSSCGGTKTLTLTYSSSCAAPLSCTSTFTIPAPTAPVLTCPTNTTVASGQTQAQVNAAFATWLATASGTGGCNGVLSNNNVGAPPATGGSTTVTFTYAQNPPSTPFNGACPFSTQTCQATFTVSASPPVVLTCPINTTTAACQTQAAVNSAFATWLATVSASGGCNGVLTNNNTGAPAACGGSTTVTFTYISTCAPLTTTCQATFTVPAPASINLICPVPTTVASCQSQAAINAQYIAWLNTFNGSGGCNLFGTESTGGVAPSACGGTNTVTFTGNSSCPAPPATCQSTFTVTAPPPVVLTCPTNTTTAACQTQAAVNTAFATWLATVSGSGGCNGVLTNNNTGAPSACGGSTTVTFTYTSTCAPLTTTCQATFTVTAAPTIVLNCPPNVSTSACQTQASVNSDFANWLTLASASGGCNGVLTNNNTGAPAACGGSTTVTFTYTSSCAPLTTTCQATFTVPTAPPVVLNCPINTTAAACQAQAAINAQFAAWLATANSSNGGCNGVLTNNNTGAPLACGGSTTVTFTYTSTCAPLTTTCQATFTVASAPTVVLTCPVNTTTAACQTQAAVNTAFATWLATASASGGCNGFLTNNNTGAPLACGGSTTVTFTYTSTCAPLTTTCQATFTVPAAPSVTLTCPVNTTAAACQTQAAVNTAFATWLATASASGGCNAVLTNNNTGAPSACGGSTTVTFTYTSTCAPLTTTCQATFTVPASPSVVLTCPVNTTTAACQTQAAVNTAFATWLATASASGGCNGVLTNNNTGAPSACGGSTTVTFTYTSSCAPTTTTCQATFTVPAAPSVTLTCPVNTTAAACQTQAAVNTAFATWLATASASGGCNGVLTNNNTGAPSACGGATTVTFTYTSTCAPLTTTCQATFTVSAAPSVVLTCPVNTTTAACQTQAAVNTAFATWLATASASGGCNGVLTNNNTGAPLACGGSTTVTFTYTNSCAPTTTTCQATFTVAAPAPILLTCPVNTTTAACQTQAAVNAAFATWLATASASGGCNGVLTNNNTGAPLACGGSTTVVFTYTSSCSPTTTTCSATFTVAAAPAVVLTCPVNTTVSACLTQAQVNTAFATWLASVSASGGCNGVLTNNSIGAPLICSPVAVVRTVVFTYTSTCAPLTTTCTATFTLPAYPDFTVPVNGASEVACPALIVQPTPPVVLDACSKTLTPTGPVIVNNPNPITCEGTRTYTWTYTDCSGHSHTWSHVVTVERQPFSLPVNGGSTVACPDQTDVLPTAPVVTSNCGEVLIPVVTSTAKDGCEGDRLYTFHYTDCEGNTADWFYTYHVEYLDFSVPASETVTVGCPLNASEPVPPIVFDNCGNQLNAIGPDITTINNNTGCEGSRTYAWTYKDCEGNNHVWSKTFIYGYTDDFFVYPDGEANVGCLLYAQPPIPPTIYDYCGQEINVTGPTITSVGADCAGKRVFKYVYTDCGGHSHPWTFTYIAADEEPPVGNCPNIDVTNLACIEDVPCPTDYDFSSKINELISTGGIFDVCSGAGINVELDSWSGLWQCSDPDGDGIFTFGRTFYFRISDLCGNEMPNLCSVTYSGVCLPLETFPQGEWGNEGGEPGNTLPGSPTDLQTITTLLGQGPLSIGGSHRSLTLTDGQCVLNLVPGVGNPTILGNCIQTNCGGCNPAGAIGMKNTLATNTISLILNMRYNVQYNGLTMSTIRAQSLNCINIDPNIKSCAEGVGCKLQIIESNGTLHQFPYTLGGLLELANLYLDGNLALTDGQKYVLASAINNSVANVNAYWHGSSATITCDPDAGDAPFAGGSDEEKASIKKPTKQELVFDLAPNPANGEVVFSLPTLPERQEVTFEIYNSYGKQLLRKDYGKVSYVRDRVSLQNVTSGLYLVTVKAGGLRSVQKLYVGKN